MVGSVISTHHYCRHLHVSDVGVVCNVVCVRERVERLEIEIRANDETIPCRGKVIEVGN